MGVYYDMNNNEDISITAENQSQRRIRPGVKISLSCEKGFFGPGTKLLLNLTRETGSLKKAAQQMEVSYSKAIKLIGKIEKQLDCEILVSRQGGPGGGRSLITDKAIDLLNRYEAYESECVEYAESIFDKHFAGF